MVTVKPPQPGLELLTLFLALAPGLASGALVFEAANQVFNFPGAPRSDPVSWGFPAEDVRTAMALAGSDSAAPRPSLKRPVAGCPASGPLS